MRNAQTFLRMKTRPLRLGMCPLPMETPPLRLGDVFFADGNAAARTFGRAYRHRPYHFSCGSVSQGCRKRLRRWTNMRNDCRRIVCRWTNTRNVWRRIVRRRTNTRNVCRRIVCRWTNTRNVCRRGARRWTKSKMIAGEVLADGQNQKCMLARCSPTDKNKK